MRGDTAEDEPPKSSLKEFRKDDEHTLAKNCPN